MLENFKKFIQTKNFEMLNQYVKTGKFSHAILLSSIDSFSTLYLAKLLALSIFQKGEINFETSDAIQIEEQTHNDVKFLPEKDSFLVYDAEILSAESYLKPLSQDYKIFIIKNIDKSTVQAQNKILKIIEEPPKNVIYIFTYENLENVLQTIKSRVQKFILEPFSNLEISMFLQEIDNFNDILNLSNGNIGKAMKYSQDKSIFITYNLVKEIMLNLKNSKDVLKFSSKLAENKNNFLFALTILSEIFRDILIYKQNKESLILHKEIVIQIEKEYSVKALLEILNKLT